VYFVRNYETILVSLANQSKANTSDVCEAQQSWEAYSMLSTRSEVSCGSAFSSLPSATASRAFPLQDKEASGSAMTQQ
jgi:hypothetical protein